MSRSSGRPKKFKYTSDQVDKSLANERLRLSINLVLALGFSAALVVLAMTPLAKSIAGTDTNFTVSISLALNFALAISTAVSGGACIELNRRRKHHQKRARELERRLKRLDSGTGGKDT